MKEISYDLEKYREYISDKELMKIYSKEISERQGDYYTFSNKELACAVYNYIEMDYCNVTFHFCVLGQVICVSDTARRKLRSKLISSRDKLIKELVAMNSAIDEIF